MRKLMLLLSVATLCAVVVIGYNLAKQGGHLTQSPQVEEPPKLAEGAEDGTSGQGGQVEGQLPGVPDEQEEDQAPGAPDDNGNELPDEEDKPSGEETPGTGDDAGGAGISRGEDGAIAVVAEPDNVAALVNPFNKLPEMYAPTDLVYPDVRFIFSEKIEKRMLREEAANALEKLFEGAEKDGIYLAGVSGYRSHGTQKALFDRYVKRDGYEKARTYSALPGTSEHETGLAIDVSGSDGKCAAADCFGDTKEAAWIQDNAASYGFIVRYPKGKEAITGYQYEPWHLRYVGSELAEKLTTDGLTLEEYYNAVPVAK